MSPTIQAVDADTVTGFGSFEAVLTSDGDPEIRDGRRLVGPGYAWYAEP